MQPHRPTAELSVTAKAGRDEYALLFRRTILLGSLLGSAGTVYFLLGLAGYVHHAALNLAVAGVVLVTAVVFLAWFFVLPVRTNRAGLILWFAILVFFLAEIVLGLLPPTARDELTHHLAIPRLYAKAGRIIEVPMAPYAYYPMLLDMLYTPWVYWGYDFVAKWIHGLYGYLTGLLLFAYLARRMSPVYGLLGFFFYVSTPVIARLSHWAYIDLGLVFYTTAALLALLFWREERERLGWLGLGSLSLGFALATKPNALVAAFLVFFLFLLAIPAPPRRAPIWVARELCVICVGAALPFLPWLIKNYVQTGNPFFPLLAGFFAGPAVHGAAESRDGGLGIFSTRELLYGENLWQLVALPLRIFFSGRDDNPQFFDGVLTPILLILLPWAFKGKWAVEKKMLLGFAALFLLYALFLVDMRIRYVLPIVPPLVILAVYGVFNIYLRIRRPGWLFAGFLLFAVWHGSYLWRYVQEAEPFGYLAGAESRSDYLTRKLPEYSSFRYINQHTETSSKIYLLFVGRRAYYCERNYYHDGGELPEYLAAVIRHAKNSEDILQQLRKRQITHLMAREDLLTRYLSHTLTASEAAVWNQFVSSRLEVKFRERGHAVYLLHG